MPNILVGPIGPGGVQDLWESVAGDSGSITAGAPTSTLTISGATGLTTSASGTTLTIDYDINSLTEDATPAGATDYVITYDADAGSHKKVLLDNLPGGGGGGGIDNVVEDTTPQLGGDLDGNGFDIQFDDATGIRDDSDNEQLIFQKTTSAVNYIEITNAATTGHPSVTANGSDTNINLTLDGKGSGTVRTTSSNLDITGNIVVSGTVDGRDVATDGTKLDGIEASADVTDEANVLAALDGATITTATVATDDKVLIQDTNDSDNLRTVTTQAIADLNPTLTTEQVQDIVGGMVTGNTETLVAVTYQDGDGTLDFVVDEASIDHDALTNFVANEHIDWTGASSNFSTTGTAVVDGSSDTIQLRVQGHSTQTTNIFEIENSAASNLFTVDNSGNVTVAGTVDGRDLETDGTKLDGIESGATADQSDSEIETAYNNQVSTVSQAEAEAGTSNIVRRWTAQRVAQAIAALETDTTLSQEQVEDYVGGMVTGNTETLITVTYQDGDGTLDFVVDNDLANYSNATSGFITASSTATLTNKTFDANGTGNSLSNVDVADLADGTDGELITWDASGNPATVSVGTSGHVLTSNGAGAAPTFQAAAGGGGGDWTLIASSTASSSSSIDFTDLDSTYATYMVTFTDVVGATDDRGIVIRTDSNNGASFDSGSSDYKYVGQQVASAPLVSQYYDNTASEIWTVYDNGGGNAPGNAGNEGISGHCFIYDPSASEYTRITGECQFERSFDSDVVIANFCGQRSSTTAVDAVRFMMRTGNITSGEFRLYGLSNA